MTVREANENDLDAVRRVAKRSWEHDHPDVPSRETVDEAVVDWYAPDRLAEELAADRTQLLVAERDDEVVGFAHATWNDEDAEGYILRLYVDPAHRRSGIGRDLLERARDELADQGVRRLHAMALAENDAGNAFYRGFGFEFEAEGETTIGDELYPEHRYVLDPIDAV